MDLIDEDIAKGCKVLEAKHSENLSSIEALHRKEFAESGETQA